jgi:RNA polymerase sigma-70 factor (ECF subfamily)
LSRAEPDDALLAGQAAAGCRDAFATLAARYQVRIVHYVRQLAGRAGRDDADDIAQDAFVRAWRAIGSYDARWAFSTWLFTIARRVCLNHARSARRRRVRETATATAAVVAADPCRAMVAAERANQLWAVASAELSEPQFSATWLRYVEGKSPGEIAVVLGRPEATVKVILFRARRRLGPLVRDLVDQE